MRYSAPLSIALLSFASFANAATITTTTMCVEGPTTVYGSNHCSSTRFDPASQPAMATGSASAAISGNALTVNFYQLLYAPGAGSVVNPIFYTTLAKATSTVNVELDTAGPVRAGYLAVYAPVVFGSEFNASGVVSINAPGYSHSCGVLYPGECPYPPATLGLALANATPLALGREFNASLTQASSAQNGPTEVGDGNWSSTIVLELFESDRVTPVDIFEVAPVPEPSSLGLVMLSLLILIAYLAIDRRKAQHLPIATKTDRVL